MSVPYNVSYIITGNKSLSTLQLLKTQSVFYQDLFNLHEEMHNLVSDLIKIKDVIRVDLLRLTVIDVMRAIIEASDYIKMFLAKRKMGQ